MPLSNELIASLKAAIKAGTKDSLNISGSSHHSLSEIGCSNENLCANGYSTPKLNGTLSPEVNKHSGATNGNSNHQMNGYQNGVSSNGHHREEDSDDWDTGINCMNPFGMLH